MRTKLVQLTKNLLVSLVSLAACLAVLEFVVFRFVLVPDDLLPNVSINGVVRYQPGTKAAFRHPDGRQTKVTINNEGWNSTKPAYLPERDTGVSRVAVIGDSYVHGAFVDTADGFPEVLEAELNRSGSRIEVLRFGMDGAPLSQYLHMLRREVRRFKPDVVVVPLIHNDFDESWRFLATRTASTFLKIGTDAHGRPFEIEPTDFKSGTADLLRSSAAFRYLYYETNAYLHFKAFINRHFWGGDEEWKPEFISSAVDIRKIADHDKNRFAARYVMAAMKAIAEADGFKLAFVMDGVREAVYSGRPRSDYPVARLNDIAAELTAELELPFLDLQETFAADFARTAKPLEYSYDWHWNAHANRLVGQAIAKFLTEDPRLLPRPRAKSAHAPAPSGG